MNTFGFVASILLKNEMMNHGIMDDLGLFSANTLGYHCEAVIMRLEVLCQRKFRGRNFRVTDF